MTLHARPVSRGDARALIDLRVRDDQRGLVASNAVTLAQAARHEPGSAVWGLWEGARPVGLIAMIDPRRGDLDEGDDPEGAFLWRLMIDAAHQGRGLGAAALREADARARAWGLPRVVTSVVIRADSALPFYLAHGFRRTGRVWDEIELVRPVAPA